MVRPGEDKWCQPRDWELFNPKWAPSLGLPQIRCLREPMKYGTADRIRVASELHGNASAQAHAMFVISKSGTDFTPWSTYRNQTHLPFVGKDFELKTGHNRAGEWSK